MELGLFRTFLAYEAAAKNKAHWSNDADSTLVNDFISFLRDAVDHRCKACANRPSERFVTSFLTNIYSSHNYLLAGIDLKFFLSVSIPMKQSMKLATLCSLIEM